MNKQSKEFVKEANEISDWLVNNEDSGLLSYGICGPTIHDLEVILFPNDRERKQKFFDGLNQKYPSIEPLVIEKFLEEKVKQKLHCKWYAERLAIYKRQDDKYDKKISIVIAISGAFVLTLLIVISLLACGII